ncbi:unnamed protein product, partial [Rodentolepis nana]|uniref:Endostatin domain-containing protein n=1 Tax=Rodentolepis nana TaxID=102285 RepID=A0A0R3TKG2_RODNA
TSSSTQINCHYFPTIDLSDGTVRIFHPETYTILMDSYVKDGQVHFNNGTSFRLGENFVKVDDDAVQRTVIVDLGSGDVEFRDLLGGKSSFYANVTSGLRLGHNIPRVVPLLVWKNASAMIDTWSGKWTVKFPGGNDFREVQKIENGTIHLLSGENVAILLKIRNPKYALTLEPHWGTISVYRKSNGHLYGRVSYDPRLKSTNAREGNSITSKIEDSTRPPIANLDVIVSTQSPERDTSVCKYIAAIDLTIGTIYLYDPKQRKILSDSEIRDGTAYFKNGSSFKTCHTFGAFDDPEATISIVNLTTGDSFLMNRDNGTVIYKSNVFRGFPQKINSTRSIIAWNNIKVHIDTQSGDWIVQDPENGQLRNAKEIIDSKIIMPDEKIIPIPLKLTNKNFLLILEPLYGSIGVYRKTTGELYGRILYNHGDKRELYKSNTPNNVQSTTAVVPLQGTEDFTEATLLVNPKTTLKEKITTEDDVAEILKEQNLGSSSDGFQNGKSSSEIEIATEIETTQDSGGIGEMGVFNLSTESSSSEKPTTSSTLQPFITGSSSSSNVNKVIKNIVSEVEEKTLPPLDKYERSSIEYEETTEEAKQAAMEEIDETEATNIEAIGGYMESSTGEIEISFSDSNFENAQTAVVEVIKKHTEIDSTFTSIQDGDGGRVVTEEQTQSTEVVSDWDIASSVDGTTEMSQGKQDTNKEEILPEEIVLVSKALVTGTDVLFSDVTQHVHISEVTDSSNASSDTISYIMSDNISQLPSTEIQRTRDGNINNSSDAVISSFEPVNEHTNVLKTPLDRTTTQSENTERINTIEITEGDSMSSQQKMPPVLQDQTPTGTSDTTEFRTTVGLENGEQSTIGATTISEIEFKTAKLETDIITEFEQETKLFTLIGLSLTNDSTTEGSPLEPITIADSTIYGLENHETAPMKDKNANLIDENSNTDANVIVSESSTPEIESTNVSMYTHSLDEQSLEIRSEQIGSERSNEEAGNKSKQSEGTNFVSMSTENFSATSIQTGYVNEFANNESKVVRENDAEISSNTAEVTTDTHLKTSSNEEPIIHLTATASTSNISRERNTSVPTATSTASSIFISDEKESDSTSTADFDTTKIRKYEESEIPTSENEEITGIKTSELNYSSGVNDNNTSESGASESGSEGQDSSVEYTTSDASIKHGSGYIKSIDVTEEEIQMGLTNDFDHLKSTFTYLALGTSRVENAEVTTTSEATKIQDNQGTSTSKNGLSGNEDTTEMIGEFLSAVPLESETSSVIQESELSSIDQETNVTITDSEIDSSLSQLLHTLLSAYEMLSEYFHLIINADQVGSATKIQFEDGKTTEFTESFKSETLIPSKLSSAESTLSNAAVELIASDNKQSPISELDETASTGTQESDVINNGQGTTTSINEVSKTLKGASDSLTEIEILDKTDKYISTQTESTLTENVTEFSYDSEQEIDSILISAEFTSTTPELPTTDVQKESEFKVKYESEITVLEKETSTPFGQTFTEVPDSGKNPRDNVGIAVQSEASMTTKNYSSVELSTLTKSTDLKSIDISGTEANVDFANSTPADVNGVDSEINDRESPEKPIDKQSSVATTALPTDKVFEVQNESRFATAFGFSETISTSNEHKTAGEDVASSQSPFGEHGESRAIFNPTQSFLSTEESEIDFSTKATEMLIAKDESSSEVVTPTSDVMAPEELFKEISTKHNIETTSSDVTVDSETSLENSEMIDQTARIISTTSQPALKEFTDSSDFRAGMTNLPANSEQPSHSDTVTETQNEKTALGVISTETANGVDMTSIFIEGRSELSTKQSETWETKTTKETSGTTTLFTDAKTAKRGNISESEIPTNDFTDATNFEVIYGEEKTTISDAVFETHDSEPSTTVAFDIKEADPSTVSIKTMDPVVVTESKAKSEDTSTRQDIKPGEFISEEGMKITVPVTNEPVKSFEFKNDTTVDEFTSERANTEEITTVSGNIEIQLTGTGSTLDYFEKVDDLETRSETLTIKDISTDKIMPTSSLVGVSKQEEISTLLSGTKFEGSTTNFENKQAESEIISSEDLSGLITTIADTVESDITVTPVSHTVEVDIKTASLSQITGPHGVISNEQNQTTKTTENTNREIFEIYSTESGVVPISSTVKVDEKPSEISGSMESATTVMSERKSDGEASNVLIEGTVVVPSNISLVEETNSADKKTDETANILTTESQVADEKMTASESPGVTSSDSSATFSSTIVSVEAEGSELIFNDNENETKLEEATEFDQFHSTTASHNINSSTTLASITDISAILNSETGIISDESDALKASVERSKWTTFSTRDQTSSIADIFKQILFNATESTPLLTDISNPDNLEKSTKGADTDYNENLGDISSTMTTAVFKDFSVSGEEFKVTEANNNVTLETIVQQLTTKPIKSESELISPSEADIIIPTSIPITPSMSEGTEESVESTATEQDSKSEIVTSPVDLTEQSSDIPTFSSKKDVKDTTQLIEICKKVKIVESSDSDSVFETEYMTTDPNSTEGTAAIPENIKIPTTEILDSSTFNIEDASKLSSLSAESAKPYEESFVSVGTDDIPSMIIVSEESFSTTTSTVSITADESTVYTERSKFTIIGDKTVETREPKSDENTHLTTETDTTIENQKFLTESTKITTENISSIETGEIELRPTSESKLTAFESTQEASRNGKDIETSTAEVAVLTTSTGESRYEQSTSTEAISTKDDLNTVFSGDRDGIFTVTVKTEHETDSTFILENGITGIKSSVEPVTEVESSSESTDDKDSSFVFSISTSASANVNGTVETITDSDLAISSQTSGSGGVDDAPGSTYSSIDSIDNANEEESRTISDSTISTQSSTLFEESEGTNSTTDMVIANSKVTEIEVTAPAENSALIELGSTPEVDVIALSSDEKSTKLESSNIENSVTLTNETEATSESLSELARTQADDIFTSFSLTMTSTTTAVPEVSLKAISTVGKLASAETNGETVSTNILEKSENRTDEIENELFSSSVPETAKENLGETSTEDFGSKLTESVATESGLVLTSSILYKSSGSTEFELSSSETTNSNYITQNTDLTQEVGTDTTEENVESPIKNEDVELNSEINETSVITERVEIVSDKVVSATTEEKLPTNGDELKSEFTLTSESSTSSEMTTEDLRAKSSEIISTKSEIDATSSPLIGGTNGVSVPMEEEETNEKIIVSINSTELISEMKDGITTENSEFPKIIFTLNRTSMEPSTMVGTEENLGSQSFTPEIFSTTAVTTETNETVSEEGEKLTELNTFMEMWNTSTISTSKTEGLPSESSEISKEDISAVSSFQTFNSFETDISPITKTSEFPIITSLKMDEIVESIRSSTESNSEARISSLETEYFSDSIDLSSAFSSFPASSEKVTKSGMSSAEKDMSSETTDAESKISDSNFISSEHESTSLVHEKQDTSDISVTTSFLPNAAKTENLEYAEQSTINEFESTELSAELNETEDAKAVDENLDSNESLGSSSTTSEDGMESSQEEVETSENSYTKITWKASSEGEKTIVTEKMEEYISTEAIDVGNETTIKGVEDLTFASKTESVHESSGSSPAAFNTEKTSTAYRITEESTYLEGVRSSDSSSTEETDEAMLQSIATNAEQFATIEIINVTTDFTPFDPGETITAESIVVNESEVESEPVAAEITENTLSPTDLGEEKILSSFQTDSASEKLSSTSPTSTPVSNCDPMIISFCQMLSRSIVDSGLQNTDTTTTATEIITTTEEPTTTPSPLADDEYPSTAQIASENDTSTLSTIISYTSDTISQAEHGYLIPIVDLSDMSVKILNTEENRIVEEAWISNGYIQFENGSSLPIRDVQGISPPDKAANNVRISINLDDGTTSLVNLETGTVIMSQKSSQGIPPEIMRNYSEGALLEILSGNMAIQVDTFHGEFTVQNAISAEIQLVQEIIDSIIYLANGDEIRLPTTGNDYEALSIDALSGIVRTINKETGEVKTILTTTLEPEIITDVAAQETSEETITLTTVESTPENEITTEMEVTKSPEVSDTSDVTTGESSSALSSEEIFTETMSSEMNVTAHPGTEPLTESNDDQSDPSKESSTSTTPEAIQTPVTSQDHGEFITETSEVTTHTSNDKNDTTENVTFSEDQDISSTEMPTTTNDFTTGISEGETDIIESAGSETTSVTFSDQEETATLQVKTSDVSSDSQMTVDSSEVTPNPLTKQTDSEVPTDAEEVSEPEDSEWTEFPEVPNATSTLKPDCYCLEKILTPDLVEKLRENKAADLDTKLLLNLCLTFRTKYTMNYLGHRHFSKSCEILLTNTLSGRFLNVRLQEIMELYKPKCDCPVNNGCSCPSPETPPAYNVSSSSKHILGALKDMSNGAIIMSNKTTLTKIASGLALGSMVYLNTENMFYLKVDEKENIWRTIDMASFRPCSKKPNTQSESVHIPEPATTTTTTVKPTLSENLIGRSLILVGHNEPLNGQLRFGAKLSGGHSSAIFACQRAAKRYNVSHIFYPLMNTDMFSMDYVVPPMYRYDMPIVNIRGDVIFDDFMHMINAQQAPMASIYTFDGKELDSDPTVPCAWIGAKPVYLNGDYEFAARAKCRNWQSREPTETGLAVHIPMNNNANAFFDQSNLYNESCAKRCSGDDCVLTFIFR